MSEKLEYLVALAREKHFGRAAISCGVTQPTLSAGIRHLEDTLGVLLVQRGSRFVGLTDEGVRALGWARRIVADTRAMRDDVRQATTGLTGHLRLAAVPSVLPAVVKLTLPYRARHPAVTFNVVSRNSAEILALLEDLHVDAGLTYLDNEPLGRVRSVPLHRECYVLAVAALDAAVFGPTVSWAEVGRVPLCLLTPDMQNRRIIDSRIQRAGGGCRTTLESNSMIVLMSHVRTGEWASVFSDGMATAFGLPPSVRLIPIEDDEPGPTIGLIYPRRDPTTPLVAALLDIMQGIGAVST